MSSIHTILSWVQLLSHSIDEHLECLLPLLCRLKRDNDKLGLVVCDDNSKFGSTIDAALRAAGYSTINDDPVGGVQRFEDIPHVLRRHEYLLLDTHRHMAAQMRSELSRCFYAKTAQQSETNRAIYHSKEEQLARFDAFVLKWSTDVVPKKGEAAFKSTRLLIDQGLTTTKFDANSSQSPQEGMHRVGNLIQNGVASGYENMSTLAAFHVLNWNMNILTGASSAHASPFIKTTHGCLHLGLVDAVNALKNELFNEKGPRFERIDNGERFGNRRINPADSQTINEQALARIEKESILEFDDATSDSETELSPPIAVVKSDARKRVADEIAGRAEVAFHQASKRPRLGVRLPTLHLVELRSFSWAALGPAVPFKSIGQPPKSSASGLPSKSLPQIVEPSTQSSSLLSSGTAKASRSEMMFMQQTGQDAYYDSSTFDEADWRLLLLLRGEHGWCSEDGNKAWHQYAETFAKRQRTTQQFPRAKSAISLQNQCKSIEDRIIARAEGGTILRLTSGQQKRHDALIAGWQRLQEHTSMPPPPPPPPSPFWWEQALAVPWFLGRLAKQHPTTCASYALPGSAAAQAWASKEAAALRSSSSKSTNSTDAPKEKTVTMCLRCAFPSRSEHPQHYCKDGGPRPRKTLEPCPFRVDYPMPSNVFKRGALSSARLVSLFAELEPKRLHNDHQLTLEERNVLNLAGQIGMMKTADGQLFANPKSVDEYNNWFSLIKMKPAQREQRLRSEKARSRSIGSRSVSPSVM